MGKKTGFIGLGAMGKPMALNPVKKGFSLWVYDIIPDKMDPLVSPGAKACTSAREVAIHCPVVITMLPGPAEARTAVLGKDSDAGL